MWLLLGGFLEVNFWYRKWYETNGRQMFNEEEKQGSLAICNRRVGELKGIEV